MFGSFFQTFHLFHFYTDIKKETLTDLLHRAYLDTSDIFRILPHMTKRKYNGCELSSPLYQQVAAEMARKRAKQGLHSTISMPINEYKPKRGKRS